jgi:hypothetical protein
MAWYFRVVEQDDHRWLCRHGRSVFDAHPSLADAIDHITDLAAVYEPAEVFVHRLDGSVESLDRQG